MLCDFRKTFNTTPLEQLEQYKFLLKIHQEQVGDCCTCVHYKGSDMPGFVTDYGECIVNEPKFAEHVVSHLKRLPDECPNYEEDKETVSILQDYIDQFDRFVNRWAELGEQCLVEKVDMKGE